MEIAAGEHLEESLQPLRSLAQIHALLPLAACFLALAVTQGTGHNSRSRQALSPGSDSPGSASHFPWLRPDPLGVTRHVAPAALVKLLEAQQVFPQQGRSAVTPWAGLQANTLSLSLWHSSVPLSSRRLSP